MERLFIQSLEGIRRGLVVAVALTASVATTAWSQCVPGGGDHACCTTGSAGCNDDSCCSTVCSADTFCCAVAWDETCVNEADSLCAGGCGPSCGNSDHDCCTEGGPFCNDADCCSAVCDVDPFCCGIAWDATCVANADALCGPCGGGPVDTDGDGINDGDEAAGCTSPTNPDTDGDGLSDGVELALGTSGCNADTDGDGLSDGAENGCTSPINPDSDNDGLNDGAEAGYGTDPCNFDSDGDDLSDGAEVTAAAGSGCPSPTNPDSDGDTINDGDEVTTLPTGTNPCSVDTDGDNLPDNIDPFPTNPGGTKDFIEDYLRDLCDYINSLNPNLFNAPNTIAKKLLRTVLAQTVCTAAKLVKCGNYNAAEALLENALKFVDGQPCPSDWMKDSAEQDKVKDELEFALLLLSFF